MTDVLACLAGAVTQQQPDFVIECMHTLRDIVRSCSSSPTLTFLPKVAVVGIILLESNFEHEYSMALQLLEDCTRLPVFFEGPCLSTVEHLIHQLEWKPTFPGLDALGRRGISSTSTCASCFSFLCGLTPYLSVPIVDPDGQNAPLHVVSLLPFLVHSFTDEQDKLARSCAEALSKHLEKRGLSLFSKLMYLYANRTYPKSMEVWLADITKQFSNAYLMKHGANVVEELLGPVKHASHPMRSDFARVLSAVFRNVKGGIEMSSCTDDILHAVVILLRLRAWEDAERIVEAVMATPALKLQLPRLDSHASEGDGLDDSDAGFENSQKRRNSLEESDEHTERKHGLVQKLLHNFLHVCGQDVVMNTAVIGLPTATTPINPLLFSDTIPVLPSITSSLPTPTLAAFDSDTALEEYFSEFNFLEAADGETTQFSDARSDCGFPVSNLAATSTLFSGSVPSLPSALEKEGPISNGRGVSDGDSGNIGSRNLGESTSPRIKHRRDSDPAAFVNVPAILLSHSLNRQSLLSASLNSISSADSFQGSSAAHDNAAPANRGYTCSSYVYYAPEHVEQTWESHVAAILDDSQGAVAVQTFACFSALYKVGSVLRT